ncbi:Tim44 domain-containing protein [Alsobacter sp. SYSU BS001988]|jgi:predicted lipid-binding transport protein (Tim44 family)
MMSMITSRRSRVLLTAAAVLALGLGAAEARPGQGGSFGSRGTKTFSAPPPTATAPRTAAPMERTITQPGAPSSVAQAPAGQRGGFFGRPGFGMGLMGGLLGAGLLGALMGNGFFGGLGGVASFLGLLLQVALVGGLVMLALRWFRSRNAAAPNGPAMAGAASNARSGLGGALGGAGYGSGMGLGGASAAPAQPAVQPLEIGPQDYAAFEKLLADVNAAWDAENEGALRRFTTPEMAAYFGEELSRNGANGQHDRVKDVKLLQGDLAEAWREGPVDYATVAMRFSVVNALFDRASGKVVGGDPVKPQEVTEIWTFRRDAGEDWKLSAIQQQA